MRVDQYVAAHAADPAFARAPALLAEGGACITYAELADRVAAAAAALARAGLAPGERALLVGENTADLVIALLGVMRAGAWAVSLNARMSAGEIDAIRAHCEPRLLYFAPTSAESLAHAQRCGASPSGEAALGGGLLAPGSGAMAAENHPDVAVLVYTSGSTGQPKGVMLTHANLDFVTRASLAQEAILPGDRVFHALPISHSFGLISALLCALRAGATVQLCARFSAERLARALLREDITVLQGVPAMYARLVEWAGQAGATLQPNRLRIAYIGGSAIDPTHKARAEALLGLPLHHGYGLTEAAPAVTRTLGHAPPKEITAGWPIPGIEVELRDPEGRRLAPGERGEVWIRGPNIMKGYFRDPVQTRAAIGAGGWLRTGDLGQFGPAGDLTVVGRLKELIIRGGFNVYPAEVEAAISAFPGVAQCAVLGHAVDGDEEVVAFVEPQAGTNLDLRELDAFLRGRLAPYKLPRRVHVMERLPASATGKLLKAALRPLLASAGEPT